MKDKDLEVIYTVMYDIGYNDEEIDTAAERIYGKLQRPVYCTYRLYPEFENQRQNNISGNCQNA